MTEKELKRLGRKDLLEILIEQAKEISSLQDTVKRLEHDLEDKRISVSESGTLAEAAIKLNGLLTDADNAAKQYIDNARQNELESRRLLEEAQKKSDAILAEAELVRTKKAEEGYLLREQMKRTAFAFLEESPGPGQ